MAEWLPLAFILVWFMVLYLKPCPACKEPEPCPAYEKPKLCSEEADKFRTWVAMVDRFHPSVLVSAVMVFAVSYTIKVFSDSLLYVMIMARMPTAEEVSFRINRAFS